MDKQIKVSIIPNSELLLNNRLFHRDLPKQTQWKGNTHWMDSNIEWFNQSINHNIYLFTYDLLPPEKADLILFMDLPEDRSQIQEIKQKAPNSKILLLLQESPIKPYWFNDSNHTDFDLILTYNPNLLKSEKYSRFFLPISHPPIKLAPINYDERKLCVLLNSNYYTGIKSFRTPLAYFKNILHYKHLGWDLNLSDILKYQRRLLYSKRRDFVKATKHSPSFQIDVYGKGWEGRNSGWFYRFFPDTKLVSNPKIFEGEKLSLFEKYRYVFAFENYQGNDGYISEKIFDAFYAGAVPIYMGDNNISDHIPKECFIDAREFKTYKALIKHITNQDKETWLKKREAIDNYIYSEEIKVFQPKHYAQTLINTMRQILNSNSTINQQY
jgi:hypothetical protein